LFLCDFGYNSAKKAGGVPAEYLSQTVMLNKVKHLAIA